MVAIVDVEECTGCGTCVEDCPVEAITLNDEDIAVIDEDTCTDCGTCVDVCPTSAISLEE
ncbi:MAG TPA: 4Fe-4S dicluster domain-containing protein [Methanosarcinales archaeon]|nr:4Fe-4S dicluster domain-containing protein [Methanosarcinales archaeon]